MLLALVMVIGMMPAMGITAMAAPGGSSMDPVICDTFAEFKAAMEDPSIIYVTLLPTNEIMPQLGEGSPVPAITVAGEKDLYLAQGVAQFSAGSLGGISPIRSSICPSVGRTEISGSRRPVGRISCSAIFAERSRSYSPGVAET